MQKWLLVGLIILGCNPANAQPPRGGSTGCDSVCQLLSEMTSGQVVELTGASFGSYASVVPNSSSDLCNFFDGNPSNTSCTGTNAPWANSTAVASAVYPQGSVGSAPAAVVNNWAFTTYNVNILTGKVCGIGGGHGPAGEDSGFYCLDGEAAAQSVLLNNTGVSWTDLIPSARYVTCSGGSKPAWSFQPNQCAGSFPYWATTNINGQENITAFHAAFCSMQVTGTSKWIEQGNFYTSDAVGYGAVEIADDQAVTTSLIQGTGQSSGGLYFVTGGTVSPSVAFDKWSGAVYSMNNEGGLGKVASPLTSGAMTSNGSMADGTQGCPYESDVVIQDPSNSAQHDYVGFGNGYNFNNWSLTTANTVLVFYNVDGTTTPTSATGGISSDACGSSADYAGFSQSFWDDDNKRILFSQGNGKVCALNFNGSNNPANWTRTADTRTITSFNSGALPTVSGNTSVYLGAAWLPSTRLGGGGIPGIMLVQFGRVWLERP